MTQKELIQKLRAKGFSKKIVDSFAKVDRGKFVSDEYRSYTYEDAALPIGHEQTISQPQTIAFMLTLLEAENKQKIMEVGSGSGYVLELLANLVKGTKIYGTERIAHLVKRSQKVLASYKNIEIIHASDAPGLPKKAPFDRILVSASAEELPKELLNQLKEGGILVCPVKESIVKAKKGRGKIKTEEFPGFIFVPLITK